MLQLPGPYLLSLPLLWNNAGRRHYWLPKCLIQCILLSTHPIWTLAICDTFFFSSLVYPFISETLISLTGASLMVQWIRICLQYRRHRRCGFDPRVAKIPWKRKWQPTPVVLPGKFHGQGSLTGCSHGVTRNWTQLSTSTDGQALP